MKSAFGVSMLSFVALVVVAGVMVVKISQKPLGLLTADNQFHYTPCPNYPQAFAKVNSLKISGKVLGG